MHAIADAARQYHEGKITHEAAMALVHDALDAERLAKDAGKRMMREIDFVIATWHAGTPANMALLQIATIVHDLVAKDIAKRLHEQGWVLGSKHVENLIKGDVKC